MMRLNDDIERPLRPGHTRPLRFVARRITSYCLTGKGAIPGPIMMAQAKSLEVANELAGLNQ
jgi:hypothetical protein